LMIFVQEAEVPLLEGEGVGALLEEEISRGEEKVARERPGESETARRGIEERVLPQDEAEKVDQPGTDVKEGLLEKDEEEDQEEISDRNGIEGANDLPEDLKAARLLVQVEVQGEANDLVEDDAVGGITAARLRIVATQIVVPVAVAVLAEGVGG